MIRILSAASFALLLALLAVAADKPGDKSAEESNIVKKAREKLATKVDVDFKDTRLEDCMLELEKSTELKFYYGLGVSKNQAVTYTAKDKPAKDVLHEMFKDRGLGYIIHRKAKEGDRYEGWIQVVQGDERGDEGKPEKTAAKPAKGAAKTPAKSDTPKKAEPVSDAEMAEKLAASRLKQAKAFLEDGQKEDAKDYLEQVLSKYPKTKAAVEAKELLEKLKK
jgi:hypothetical protein